MTRLATTFEGNLAALRTRGTLAVHGTASGPTPALLSSRLNSGGSLYVTKPSVGHYTVTTEELRRINTSATGTRSRKSVTRYAPEARRTTGNLRPVR